jgi:hypothetical protein
LRVGATQGEFGERCWVLTGAFALEEWAAVAGGALATFACRLSSIVEGAICSAPDSALPVLRYVKSVIGARRKSEAAKSKYWFATIYCCCGNTHPLSEGSVPACVNIAGCIVSLHWFDTISGIFAAASCLLSTFHFMWCSPWPSVNSVEARASDGSIFCVGAMLQELCAENAMVAGQLQITV